jgi:4-hydroxy-tetrahydrodipicolinate synthase
MMGIKVGGFRPPLTPADEKTKKMLEGILKARGLIQ